MVVHCVFNAQMKFRGGNHQEVNVIITLMQSLQFYDIKKVQLIMQYTSSYYMMELCPILRFLLIMLWILIIRRHNSLKLQRCLNMPLRLNPKKDLSLSNWILNLSVSSWFKYLSYWPQNGFSKGLFPYRKFRNVGTTFLTDLIYEK